MTPTRVRDVLKAHEVAWCTKGATAALERTRYYQTDALEIYAAPRAMTNAIARELKAQPTGGRREPDRDRATDSGTGARRPQEAAPVPAAPALLAYAAPRVLERPQYGFTRTPQPFRMERGPAGIDVLPYNASYGRLPIRSRALPLARSRAETLGFDCAAGRGEPARGDVG
jgi:hypothetical protein